MPNLLFLTPQLPHPPRQGTAIRNWGLIKHLAERHTITLLSFVDEGQSAESTELRAACRKIVTIAAPRRSRADRLRTLFSPDPDLARRLWSPDFSHALTALLRESQFDLIHIEGLEMAPYLPLLRGLNANSKIIYDAHNAEHVIQRRAFTTDLRQPKRWLAALYSWLQIPRLEKFEDDVCRSVDAILCVSEEDAVALRKLTPELKTIVIPNGIDLEEYQGPRAKGQGPRTKDKEPRTKDQSPTTSNQQPTLVFTGKMDYRPNLDAAWWFATEILPRIQSARPLDGVQFVVVGQKPPEWLLKLNGQNGVMVTGAVEDTRPFIAESTVYVAPLRMGGGTRFKLLEAMALARPIVSTTIGAEGFAVRSSQELLLADTSENFAAAVLQLLNDPARAAAIGQAGHAFAQAHYDWSVIIPKLEEMYESMTSDSEYVTRDA